MSKSRPLGEFQTTCKTCGRTGDAMEFAQPYMGGYCETCEYPTVRFECPGCRATSEPQL